MPNANPPPEYSAGLPISLALAFVGGYSDAATYVMARVFAGHISGNLAMAAVDSVDHNWSRALFTAYGVVLIVLGLMASSALDTRPLKRIGAPLLVVAIAVEALLFLVPGTAILLGVGWPVHATVLVLCFALGLQTGTVRRTHGTSVYTAFMAGMVTRIIEGGMSRLEHRNGPNASHVGVLTGLLLTFVIGACTGAAMERFATHWTVFAAGLALVILTGAAWVRSRNLQRQQAT